MRGCCRRSTSSRCSISASSSSESTTSPEYGGLSDLALTRVLLAQTRPGGHVLIFSGSFAHDQAEAVAAELERAKELAFVEDYKSLKVYRKVG